MREYHYLAGTIIAVLAAFSAGIVGGTSLDFKKITPQWDIGNTFVGVASTIAAIASVWIATNTKKSMSKQRMAEFRLKWVEELRSEIAEVCALCRKMSILTHAKSDKNKNELRSEHNTITIRCLHLISMIDMKMNNKDESHKKFLSDIIEFYRISCDFYDKYSDGKEIDRSEEQSDLEDIRKMHADVVESSKIILKSEWNRIKTELT